MIATVDFTGPVHPSEFTIRELAEKIIALTGSKPRIVYNPVPSEDPRQHQPDIALASTVLGWEPTISLKLGLSKTIAHFEEVLVHQPRPMAGV